MHELFRHELLQTRPLKVTCIIPASENELIESMKKYALLRKNWMTLYAFDALRSLCMREIHDKILKIRHALLCKIICPL